MEMCKIFNLVIEDKNYYLFTHIHDVYYKIKIVIYTPCIKQRIGFSS